MKLIPDRQTFLSISNLAQFPSSICRPSCLFPSLSFPSSLSPSLRLFSIFTTLEAAVLFYPAPRKWALASGSPTRWLSCVLMLRVQPRQYLLLALTPLGFCIVSLFRAVLFHTSQLHSLCRLVLIIDLDERQSDWAAAIVVLSGTARKIFTESIFQGLNCINIH